MNKLNETLNQELLDIEATEDVFDQLLELHEKVQKTYGVQMELEDFGSHIKRTFRRRDFKHLLKTMTKQKSSTLKSGTFEDLELQEVQTTMERLIKTFKTKNFSPNAHHLQECLGLMDDLEGLTLAPDQEITLLFNNLFEKHYGTKELIS